jgi:hypothetical protein
VPDGARIDARPAVGRRRRGGGPAATRRPGVECSEITVFDERDGGTFFGFSDPDGNTWTVQHLKLRAEKPLIPPEARGRFGA